MYDHLQPARPTLFDRAGYALAGARDFLDARGTYAWLAAMVAGFVLVWPLGLAILGYMIWSKRMFGTCTTRRHRHHSPAILAGSTGNAAFDAYRAETLKRLEEESAAFQAFLQKLREAKDKSEFDQFMEQRRSAESTPPAPAA